MPQVAKVIAIRNRKICMTRLYLWTKSNTRPTGGTKSEFYPARPGRRPMMPRCWSFLPARSDPHQRADDHRKNQEPQEADAPLPEPFADASAGVLEIHGAVLAQDRNHGGRVRICSSHGMPPLARSLFAFRAAAQSGKPLDQESG